MYLAVALILVLAGGVASTYDRYSVQRSYADACAQKHGHIPPLVDWFFNADPDPEVDAWRRYHRNLYVLSGVFAAAAVVVLLIRPFDG